MSFTKNITMLIKMIMKLMSEAKKKKFDYKQFELFD